MSRFLLDTNIWIALAKKEPGLTARVAELPPGQVASCSVVRAELLYGARKSEQVNKNLLGFEELLAPFVSLPFDDDAASHYGMIRSELERAGTPIGGNDVLIASIARAHDCVVITRNKREFQRVAGLRFEQW